MSDNFAFLLPVMMGCFACAFFIVWRAGVRSALAWSLGYGLSGLGFLVPVLPGLSDPAQAVLADGTFALAFFFYGQALAIRFDRPRRAALGLAFVGAAVAASAVSVLVLASLRLELLTSDYLCSLLVLVPLLAVRRAARRPIDRAIWAIMALVITDNVVRGSTALFTTATDSIDSYLGSTYAFLEQTSAAVLGLVFGMTALAGVTLDVVERYRLEAVTDPLTGLLNRRGFLDAARGTRSGAPQPGHVLTCDLDHFKRVNDACGHGVGDAVLIAFADILRRTLPPEAVAARFGGEEFTIFLPAGGHDAPGLADALRAAVSDHAWDDVGVAWQLTASFGLTDVRVADGSVSDAVARADKGLYDAKNAGRNRVAFRSAA